MLFGSINEINVSAGDIKSYINAVNCALDSINDFSNKTIDIGNSTLRKAGIALENAQKALEIMINDYNLAQKTMVHNKKMLEYFHEQLKKAQEAKTESWELVKATGNTYRKAAAEQTKIKGSSIGPCSSAEEEKRAKEARATAMREANSLVDSTRLAYERAQAEHNRICALERELEFKINRAISAIEQLERIINSLDFEIRNAQAFCNNISSQINCLESALKSFVKASKRSSDSLSHCISYANDAELNISHACSFLENAGEITSGYYNERIIMSGTHFLKKAIKGFNDICVENEQLCNTLINDARHYGNSLQDDISEEAVYTSLNICNNILRVNEELETVKESLKSAKKELDNYLQLEFITLR